MAYIYRAMLREGNQPAVGGLGKALGVRLPPDPHPDIVPNEEGAVLPQTGGMSVVPDWRKLPYFLIPQRLKHLVPKARGSNELVCWRMGESHFVAGGLTDRLSLRIDRPSHALIEPRDSMSARDFQSALAATRTQWLPDES